MFKLFEAVMNLVLGSVSIAVGLLTLALIGLPLCLFLALIFSL